MSEMPDRINILPGEYPDSGYGARVYYGPKKPPGTTEYIRIPTSISDPVVVDGERLREMERLAEDVANDCGTTCRQQNPQACGGSGCVGPVKECPSFRAAALLAYLTGADGPVEP